jgi:hypothetical protein
MQRTQRVGGRQSKVGSPMSAAVEAGRRRPKVCGRQSAVGGRPTENASKVGRTGGRLGGGRGARED